MCRPPTPRAVTGTIAFDRYGDTTDPRFTLYRVEGTPLAWTQDSP